MSKWKPCPTGCARKALRQHAMCGPCWSMVPLDVQQRLLRAWAAWKKDFGDDEKMEAYETALEDCIASVA